MVLWNFVDVFLGAQARSENASSIELAPQILQTLSKRATKHKQGNTNNALPPDAVVSCRGRISLPLSSGPLHTSE